MCVCGVRRVCVCVCVCVGGVVHTCVGDVCVGGVQACVGMCVCVWGVCTSVWGVCVCGVEGGVHAVFVCVCIGRGYTGRVACL